MEVENLASREMDTTYLSLVEVVVFKAWVKEKWEEREVERLTRQRPTAQRSDSLYNFEVEGFQTGTNPLLEHGVATPSSFMP